MKRRVETEAALERWCVARARARGWLSRKMNGLGFRDWPDRLFVRPPGPSGFRRPIWVEFKRAGGRPTDAQAHLHAELRRRGDRVEVIDDRRRFVEEVLDV